MLQILVELKLVAVLDESGSLWTSVDGQTAHLMDRCCTGQKDGGPEAGTSIGAIIESFRGQEGTMAGTTTSQATSRDDRTAIRLSLEEGFFLKHALNALTVVTQTDGRAKELSEQELWERCRSIRGCFVTTYAGYHHLKSKGWLPRSGLLYGVDYVAYQMHPTCCHSDFGFLLMPLRSKGKDLPDLNWRDLQIANRLIGQVAKRLILLFLTEDRDSSTGNHETPECLQYLRAEERMVKRFVPSVGI
jgi:tRNA splicing endonuclease